MSESFVEFWKRFDPNTKTLQIHPDDLVWLQQNWPAVLDQELYRDSDSYIKGSRFGSKDVLPHLSLLPVPFIGDLERARVVIFAGNAGFVDADYFLDFDAEFRPAFVENLRQGPNRSFPLTYLDPRFAWSEAFQWWERKFQPLLDELRKEFTYVESLRLIANRVAVVELFPYHSRDASNLRGLSLKDQLPSVARAREYLAQISGDDSKLKLVMRKHTLWHHDACQPQSEHYIHGPRIQSISFSSSSDVGRNLIQVLMA